MTADDTRTDFDAVIYGATVGGLMAAQRLSMRGHSVCVVEPTRWIGGVTAGGLTMADIPQGGTQKTIFRGLSRRFFERVSRAQGPGTPIKRFFPRFASQVAGEVCAEAGARVITDSPLHVGREGEVTVRGGRITAIRTRTGEVTGRAFIDASYEGDLMAAAGAPYRVGREARGAFDEPMAGFCQQSPVRRSGFSRGVHPPARDGRPDTEVGGADASVLPMNFRGTLWSGADRLAFPRPDGYEADRYAYLLDLVAMTAAEGPPEFLDFVRGYELPDGARNWNGRNIVSIDLFGRSEDYPEAGWDERARIVREVADWNQGFFYFLSHDPRLPEGLREDAARWGLSPHEFTGSPYGAGFPPVPYVREGRRLRGRATVTAHDQNAPDNEKADRICRWNYRRDGKGRLLWTDGEGSLFLEGVFRTSDPARTPDPAKSGPAPKREYGEVDTYDVPLGAILPASGPDNLAVSTCVSASAVAWTSIRMEPAFAMMGEAAGELAGLVVERDQGMPDVRTADLQDRLREHGTHI